MIKIVVESNTFYIPLVDGSPIWSGFDSSVIAQLQSAYDSDNYQLIPASEPQALSPNWDGLLNAILGGNLFAIYSRLTSASFIDPAIATDALLANANNIAVASGKLDQAVQVTKVEGAVAASFQMLIASSNYRFTAEEKTLWDATVTALNFSQAMFLP